MLQQCQRPIADRVNRGPMSCRQQQKAIGQQFLFAQRVILLFGVKQRLHQIVLRIGLPESACCLAIALWCADQYY